MIECADCMNRRTIFLIVVLAVAALFAGLWLLLPKHYQLSEHMTQSVAFWNDHEAFVFLNLNLSGRTTNAMQEKLLRSPFASMLVLLGWNDMFYQPKIVAYQLLADGELDRFELPADTVITGTWSLQDGKLKLVPWSGLDRRQKGLRWDGERFQSVGATESARKDDTSSQLTEDDLGEDSRYPSLIAPSERDKFRRGGWHVKAISGYESRDSGAFLPMEIGKSRFRLLVRSAPLNVDVFDFGALNSGAQSVELASEKPGQEPTKLWQQSGWREVPQAEYRSLADRTGNKASMPKLPWVWLVAIFGLFIWRVMHWGNLLFSRSGAKQRVMKSIPTSYSFPPASPGQFSGLDTAALERYTREFEGVGFTRLSDLSLVSDAPSYVPNFCRVMANSRNHCFVEITQFFPPKRPVWPMRCALFGGLQDGWTVTFSDRKPLAAASLLRRPNAVSVSMPEATVPELLQAFTSMRDQVAIDLGIVPLKDDTIEAFMSKVQRAVSEVRQRVQNRNFAAAIPEIYFRKFSLLKTRPEYVWLGDYPKMAEQRKQGYLAASGTKI